MNKKRKLLKGVQIASIIVFIISVFVAIDLGMNFAGALVPSLNDGIGFRSILHGFFRIFGDGVVQLEDFYFAFYDSVWFAFFMMIENIVLETIIKYIFVKKKIISKSFVNINMKNFRKVLVFSDKVLYNIQ